MIRLRRYLRGSGRALAFVFIASVIWLLFDMAALRLSITDVNSKLLKEQVIQEREAFKRQLTRAGKAPLDSRIQLARVYRQGGKKPDRMLGEKHVNSSVDQGGKSPKMDRPKDEYKQGAASQNVTLAKKKEAHLNLTRKQVEKMTVIDDSMKVLPHAAVSDPPKTPLDARESKRVPLPASTKALVKSGAVQNAPDAKTSVKVEEGPKAELQALETHPVKITTEAPSKTVIANVLMNRTEEKHVGVTQNHLQESANATIRQSADEGSEGNATVRKSGLHRVFLLDVTRTPRDSNALGQFGQAALVSVGEDAEVKKRWDEGHFNVYLSDKIPVDRAVPDTRPET